MVGLIAAFVSARLPAQSDPLLERFAIQHDNGHVLLDWVTRPGTTCEGVDVFRSTDSLNFTRIHHIPGICGGPTTSIAYSYIDEHPVANYRNYYRLSFGNLGTSAIRSVEVVALGKEGYQVRPNPVVDFASVYFENSAFDRCRLVLVDASGSIVEEWETPSNRFEVDATGLRPGLYFLRIQDPEGKIKAKGKLLVVH